jgi:hypothetical protein
MILRCSQQRLFAASVNPNVQTCCQREHALPLSVEFACYRAHEAALFEGNRTMLYEGFRQRRVTTGAA